MNQRHPAALLVRAGAKSIEVDAGAHRPSQIVATIPRHLVRTSRKLSLIEAAHATTLRIV
jgi:hypothetical protein